MPIASLFIYVYIHTLSLYIDGNIKVDDPWQGAGSQGLQVPLATDDEQD